MEDKDYLYYFWQNSKEDWIREFAPLWKDKTLIGLTVHGWTDKKTLPQIEDFNLEELMATVDTIKCYFHSPSGRYNKFNEEYSSYGLKHLLERTIYEITKGRLNYVSNDTLILAMYHCGYKFQRISGTPNCYFNLPKKSIKRMEEAREAQHFFNTHPDAKIYFHDKRRNR